VTRADADDAVRASPLHVVHVISGLGQGGAETVLYRLVTAPGQANRNTVVSLTGEGVLGPRLRQAGIPVVALGMKPGLPALAGLRALYRCLRGQSPDVVQTWMYHADLIGGVAARLAGIRAVSWGIRNSGANLHKGSRLARVVAWVCARVSGVVPAAIVACAQDAAARHRRWGYASDKLRVIPNGYDFARWRPDAAARARLRAEWGIPDGVPLAGSVARWNPLKDHANLLAALARCVDQAPGLRCVLAGQDMEASNGALMALIDRHGLRENVVLLGRRQDIPEIMSALDVHVLSSCAEGFPNVVAEAMATGALCVVTDVGDAARIVDGHGWVAPPSDPGALARAIRAAVSALGTAQAAHRIGAARESVTRRYSLQAMVDGYDQVWRGLAREFPADAGTQVRPAGGAPAAAGRRLMFVVNNPAFFLSHRLPLARAAARAGFDVHVATMDGSSVPDIVAQGFAHHVIPLSRSGKNPVQELRSLYALWRLFRRVRPAIVHAVTIKPVLYGGIAARLAGVPAFVAAISGLGYLFTRSGADAVRWAAIVLYRLALGHGNSRVIFQNDNDLDVLRKAKVVRAGQAVLIRGSGVDLDVFRAVAEPDGVVVVMASRLLHDKGVREFVDAARLAAANHPGVRWVLAGSLDPGNPASVTDGELAAWRQEGVLRYVGEQDDVASLYAKANIVVLPSYREGMPKSLIEAAACARAVVTTDVPGCRDAIEPGVTGLLVPARDARALATAVLRLADDADLRRAMGEAGRRLAERAFDVHQVEQAHLDIYRALSGG